MPIAPPPRPLSQFRPMSPSDEILAVAIGKRLKRRRRELGLPLAEIGRRAGVSHQQIRRFEAGEIQIAAAMVWKLAQALGVSIRYLFGEADDADTGPTSGAAAAAPAR